MAQLNGIECHKDYPKSMMDTLWENHNCAILWLCLGTCNKTSQRTLKKIKEVSPGSKAAIWRKFRMNELIKSIFEHGTMLNAEIPLRMSSIDCCGNVPQKLKHWLKNNSTSSVVAFETVLAEDWDKMCRIHLVLTAHLPKKMFEVWFWLIDC